MLQMLSGVLNRIGLGPNLLLGLVFFNIPAFCLPTDKNQPIELRAGSADINQQTHEGIYLQDVQLDQGSTHIRAHKATTTGNEKNQLTLAIIEGNKNEQAHYWTVPAENKPAVHAYANLIKYYPDKHLIELVGKARVEQANNSFSAPLIIYDIQAQHVVSQSTSSARTTIIFHPETHK